MESEFNSDTTDHTDEEGEAVSINIVGLLGSILFFTMSLVYRQLSCVVEQFYKIWHS